MFAKHTSLCSPLYMYRIAFVVCFVPRSGLENRNMCILFAERILKMVHNLEICIVYIFFNDLSKKSIVRT